MTGLYIILGLISLLVLIGLMGIFSKAREPIFFVLVPFLNAIALARIGGLPPLYGLLACIPVAGLYWAVLIWMGVLAKFGKPPWHIAFVLLLGIVYIPLLGLGPDEYGTKYRRRKKLVRIRRTFESDEDWDRIEEEAEASRRFDEDDEDEEEEEEEERPKRRRRKPRAYEEDEEEDDEPPPRRRPSRVSDEDDEEEERPRRRRPRVEDEEDEDEEPRARRRRPREDDDDEEDERPRRTSRGRRRDDDDDD